MMFWMRNCRTLPIRSNNGGFSMKRNPRYIHTLFCQYQDERACICLPRYTFMYKHVACCVSVQEESVEAKKSNFVVTYYTIRNSSSNNSNQNVCLACLLAPFVCIFVYRMCLYYCSISISWQRWALHTTVNMPKTVCVTALRCVYRNRDTDIYIYKIIQIFLHSIL